MLFVVWKKPLRFATKATGDTQCKGEKSSSQGEKYNSRGGGSETLGKFGSHRPNSESLIQCGEDSPALIAA